MLFAQKKCGWFAAVISQGLLVVGFVGCGVSFCLAGDKEDKAAVTELIAMVEANEPAQAESAEKLFSSIPADSNRKPVAAYSLAIVQIREGKYSEAWKLLASTANVPDPLKTGKERLKLWLLLQAGASDKAEPLFKRLVTESIGADAPKDEQVATCNFVGGVVGMLKSDSNAPCIPIGTLDKARALLLKEVESQNAKSKLEERFNACQKWGVDLTAKVNEFEQMGNGKATEQNKMTQEEFERKKQELATLNNEMKATGKDKQKLEEERRRGIGNRNQLQKNLKIEESNQPSTPVDPGPRPRRPSEPRERYRTDPKTQKEERIEPTSAEKNRYKKELEEYNSWPKRKSQYERDVDEYPAKVERWKQNMAAIRVQIQAVSQFIDEKQSSIAMLVEGIKQGVGSDVKQTNVELDELERSAALSELALKIAGAKDPKFKALFRPSNFNLLDYESECMRLRKSLREP